MFFKFIKTRSPFLYKLCIVDVFFDNNMYHRKGKGSVRPWPYRQPLLAIFTGFRPSGINGNAQKRLYPAPFLQRWIVLHPVPDTKGLCPKTGYTSEKLLRNNPHHKPAIGEITHRNPGDETLCKSWFIPVWRSKGVCKPHHMHIMMPSGSPSQG